MKYCVCWPFSGRGVGVKVGEGAGVGVEVVVETGASVVMAVGVGSVIDAGLQPHRRPMTRIISISAFGLILFMI